MVSLLLLAAFARRLVHGPSQALRAAARRWARGDFAARAVMPDPAGAGLAAAFNTMAEALAARHQRSEELSATLEACVAARTRTLSETNNRLLVEIAERERTDTALRHAQKLQAVGQLAGGVAHEFNNLLTTMLGALELISRRQSADPAVQRRVAAATEAAQRGASLTSQLLTFARRRRLMPAPVDLNDVIRDMRDLLEGSLGRSITLRFDLGSDPWPALADRAAKPRTRLDASCPRGADQSRLIPPPLNARTRCQANPARLPTAERHRANVSHHAIRTGSAPAHQIRTYWRPAVPRCKVPPCSRSSAVRCHRPAMPRPTRLIPARIARLYTACFAW